MKAHAYRLLNNLPDLCLSPLTGEVRITVAGKSFGPILEARIDNSSVFVRLEGPREQWMMFDREALESLTTEIIGPLCVERGIEPRLDALLAHLETRRKVERL